MRTLATLLALALSARNASAECWLRDDGTEICSPEPLAWRIASWIWFAALVLVFAFICGWDAIYCCCCCQRKTKTTASDADTRHSIRVTDDNDSALTEPLLPPIVGKGSSTIRPPKYRYLDP